MCAKFVYNKNDGTVCRNCAKALRGVLHMASSKKELEKLMTSRNVKRQRRKRMRVAALLLCVILCGAIAVGGMNVYVTRMAAGRILTPAAAARQEDFDVILVLGAAVWANGVPSHMLEDRLRRGVELYEAGAAPVLLMSGGSYEVDAMRNFAMELGVAEESIWMDDEGLRTYESMRRARDAFELQRVLIVTQRYHLYRAIYLAGRLGLEGYGVASDLRGYRNQARHDAREAMARMRAIFDGVIGEIDIFG